MYESLSDYKRRRKKEFANEIGIPLTLAVAIIFGGIAMVSCSIKKQEKENIHTDDVVTKTDLQNEISDDVNADSVKTFDEGEHILSIRVQYGCLSNGELTGYAINNMPEGYEVFQITPYTNFISQGSATEGYDIWFKNTEPVEVHSTYNEVLEQYGYYTFEKVIEKEKVLEK